VAPLAALAEADEPDTPLGDQVAGQALGRAEQLGGLGDGSRRSVSLADSLALTLGS
jgi:hypothetical protein